MVGHTPLTEGERTKLYNSLRRNVDGGALYMGRDTSVIDINSDGANEAADEVINAVQSIPSHY